MNDRMTFYGATNLEARRRALRFQAENLDYVLTAVVEATWDLWAHGADPTHVPGEQSITMYVQRLHNMDVASTISGTRIILLERAAAVLKLPEEEAMAMAYAGGEDATAAEQRVRLEVTQKERHRSVAATKGATARAAGWPRTAKHGYVGANAIVWEKAWDYCDSAMRHEASKDDDASDPAILRPSHVEDAGPPTVRLTLARMTATASVDCHDIMGNRQLGPGSYGVLRDVARLAGWKYARHKLANRPATTLLWADGVEEEKYDRAEPAAATEAPHKRRPVKAELSIASAYGAASAYRVAYDNGSYEFDDDQVDYTAYAALIQVARLMNWDWERRESADGQPAATEIWAPGESGAPPYPAGQFEEGAGVHW
jgi:hypothetical protein